MVTQLNFPNFGSTDLQNPAETGGNCTYTVHSHYRLLFFTSIKCHFNFFCSPCLLRGWAFLARPCRTASPSRQIPPRPMWPSPWRPRARNSPSQICTAAVTVNWRTISYLDSSLDLIIFDLGLHQGPTKQLSFRRFTLDRPSYRPQRQLTGKKDVSKNTVARG